MPELYPIGKHLRLKPSCSSMLGYTTKIFQVIGYSKNSGGQDLYLTSIKFYSVGFCFNNEVFVDYVMEDEECIMLDRKNKLICLNSIQ